MQQLVAELAAVASETQSQ